MKQINCTLFLVLFINLLYAQNPLVKQWDYRFGGTNDDLISFIQQTADGGYILAGISYSGINGDKTKATWGGADYWIVKIDSLGNKQWDKDFGGTGDDVLNSIQQTADGGYILGGTSNSGISGDKTQIVWGLSDYWIVKTDPLGNKQWDKDFGAFTNEYFKSLKQTNDGGYIIGGYSDSGIGGDKTQVIRGGYDYWIIKTDSLGNKQWDKDFGGVSADVLYSVQQTADGEYILGGYSTSPIGGDKTQSNWGFYDYWIVKTDSLGNKLWDKDFGGTTADYCYSLQQTADGGYILGGTSNSGISGDKTQANWGIYDYWIVKTDSLGNKQWDKDFGGIDDEADFGNISQTTDGGYILAGTSYSNINGDKTENNLCNEQTWVIKTNSLGFKQWDKTLHTNSVSYDDETGFVIQTKDGCYVMANATAGGIGGDKTQLTRGSYDYWIINFCDTTAALGIVAQNSLLKFSIYPNPFTSVITVGIQKQNLKQISFTIKNIFGQTVFSQQENNVSVTYTKEINLSFLYNGTYFLEINIDGERSLRKIIKQ